MGNNLSTIATQLLADGRGVFAADASPKTLGGRAKELGLNLNSLDDRLAYRKMTLSAPELGKYIGGVILHEEAIELAGMLKNHSMLPGVKVDQGTKEVSVGSVEKITLGLEGLANRLARFVQQGAKFTKWRAVFTISSSTPSQEVISKNAEDLATYAKVSQEAGLVPVVEPEVLMEGEHDLNACAQVTAKVGKAVFDQLAEKGVDISAMLYKPNMTLPGKSNTNHVEDLVIAKQTVDTLDQFLPDNLPGVVFLSGGQDAMLTTVRLNDIAKLWTRPSTRPSFSFERALEGPVMQVWAGKEKNVIQAQRVLLHRARCNSLASLGKYSQEVENEN